MAFLPGISSSATHGRLFVLDGQSLCVAQDDQSGARIPTGLVPSNAIYLGDCDNLPCFAAQLEPGLAPPEATRPIALRQLFGVLNDEDFAIAGRALALTGWDRDHRFCGRCGTATERSPKERVRTCPRCEHGTWPRISPAVIAMVEREGRILLGRNAHYRLPFFSVLAGFVEVGESLEETVRREIQEEVGVSITDIRYFGSQPWPFSDSLMVGFTARWAGGEIVCQPDEIAEADWFLPDALPAIPPKLSIARQLIDDFVRRQASPTG